MVLQNDLSLQLLSIQNLKEIKRMDLKPILDPKETLFHAHMNEYSQDLILVSKNDVSEEGEMI